MTDEQVQAIATADNATLTFVNLLVSFLETKGVMSRAEFTDFVTDSVAAWRAEGLDPLLARFIEIKATAFMTDGPPTRLN